MAYAKKVPNKMIPTGTVKKKAPVKKTVVRKPGMKFTQSAKGRK